MHNTGMMVQLATSILAPAALHVVPCLMGKTVIARTWLMLDSLLIVVVVRAAHAALNVVPWLIGIKIKLQAC